MAKTLNSVIHQYIKKVNTLMKIIKKLRRDIDLAIEIMSPEQQATFYEGVRLLDKAIAENEEE